MKFLNGFLQKTKSAMKKNGLGFIVSKGNSSYPYTNTRVRVMKTKLLQQAEMQKMLKMSFPEIARFLQETEYNREISELAIFYSEANLIEYSLNKNLENTFAKILSFSIGESQEQARIYLKKFDVANVKIILSARFSANASDQEILAQLVCAGELDRAFFENLLKNSKNFTEAIEQLKGTEYYETAKKHSGNLPKLLDELDKQFYVFALALADTELQEFLADEIKIKNMLNRMRAEKTDLKLELLENESKAKINLPKNASNVENRIYLKKFLLERGNKMVREFEANLRPLLGYFIAKENEVANIRMIVRGKTAGIAPELIEQQMVI